MLTLLALFLISAVTTGAQEMPPNSWPQNYTGIPTGGHSPEWQTYFEVPYPLPNVTFPLSRSYAVNVNVNRAGHPNDTLFFWAFEKENGSLSAGAGERSDEPWFIWLNGGPGASSLIGFFEEHGPMKMTPTYEVVANNYSWHKLADVIYLDQPVGVGYSTADTTGYIYDEDQTGEDFLAFLSNLVLIFPSLAQRPFYLLGESYGGIYVPYIAKAILSSPNPPVKLAKFAVGDGTLGSQSVYQMLANLNIVETYPQIISWDPEIYEYFKQQTSLCGYDLNFTYPQDELFPTLPIERGAIINSSEASAFAQRSSSLQSRLKTAAPIAWRSEGERRRRRRDLSANGMLDPWYGCDLEDMLFDYMLNYTFPWTLGGLDGHYVPDALNPELTIDESVFMNDNRTRAALHAPMSKDWTRELKPLYPFRSTWNYTFPGGGVNIFGDPSPEPMVFLSELAANASLHNTSIVFYNGNADLLVGHHSTEVVIQNMTFGGIQGFSRPPSTPWYDDDGNFAKIIHQECGLTWVLFDGAGHEVPEYKLEAAFVFVREFIFGSNSTGLVTTLPDGTTTVMGREASPLADDVLPAWGAYIYYGSSSSASSTLAPSATIAGWSEFFATATATAV